MIIRLANQKTTVGHRSRYHVIELCVVPFLSCFFPHRILRLEREATLVFGNGAKVRLVCKVCCAERPQLPRGFRGAELGRTRGVGWCNRTQLYISTGPPLDPAVICHPRLTSSPIVPGLQHFRTNLIEPPSRETRWQYRALGGGEWPRLDRAIAITGCGSGPR